MLEQLRDAGLKIDDVLGAIRIVNGLPPEYEVFIRNIKVFEKDFNLENLKIPLLQEEATIILGNSHKTAVEPCAMVAQPKYVWRGRGPFPRQGRGELRCTSLGVDQNQLAIRGNYERRGEHYQRGKVSTLELEVGEGLV